MNMVDVKIDGYIAVVSLCRIKQRNALNTEMLAELCEVFKALGSERKIRCIVITGDRQANAFAAGADVAEMVSMDEEQAVRFSQLGCAAFRLLEQAEKPVIAAINGYALGGGLELALACDIRVAIPDAKIGLPETTLGIMPGFDGIQRLTCLAGYARTAELVFSGRIIPACDALVMGIINACFEQDTFWERTMELAHEFCKTAPLAVAGAKKVMRKTAGYMRDDSALFGKLFRTRDQKTGMQNMLLKRKTEYFEGE